METKQLLKDYSPVEGVIVSPDGTVTAFANELAKWEAEGFLKNGKIVKNFKPGPHKVFHPGGTVTLSPSHAKALQKLGYVGAVKSK
ncbi:MAG: hypothetical protein HEP71_30890 [Roseivirga sp.]|nr:hypothetical protein [Roseivirga sp.]